jgi:hypothetical protein
MESRSTANRTDRLSPVPGLIVAALLLLLAITRMPYGYYVFMRWVVCAACVYGAWVAYLDGHHHVWTWLLGAAAFLFNPLVPVRMHRADWVPFNLVGFALLSIGAIALRPGSVKR